MCFPAKCASCGLTTWGGCGKHVPSVYKQVPKGQVCMCKPWPGVQFAEPPRNVAVAATEGADAATSATTTAET